MEWRRRRKRRRKTEKKQLLGETNQSFTRELGGVTFISGTLTPLFFANTAIFFPLEKNVVSVSENTLLWGAKSLMRHLSQFLYYFPHNLLQGTLTTQGSLKREG